MPLSNEEALFALDLLKPRTERGARLDRECGDDRALRQRVDGLPATHPAVFPPEDNRAATGAVSGESALHLWDVASWQEVLTLEAEGPIFWSTQFSPDGNRIGTESQDGTLNFRRAPSASDPRITVCRRATPLVSRTDGQGVPGDATKKAPRRAP